MATDPGPSVEMPFEQGLGDAAEAHFRNPCNAGALIDWRGRVGTGAAGAVQSGVVVRYQLGLGDDGSIKAVGWECFGPPAAIAAASWLSEQLRGMHPADRPVPTALEVHQALDLPDTALGPVLVVEDAVLAALRSFQGPNESVEVNGR